MKKVVLFFGLLILATITFAQAPQAFNYQAVIRDADGNLLENQAVGIKTSLLQGTSTGQEVYAETHATTTNPYGLVDLQIGTGTILTGQFDTIAWGAGPYYLQLAVDLTGGANYAVMGTTQMLSVPYALYAEEGSGWEKTENGIGYFTGNVGIGTQTIDSNDRFHIKMANGKGSFRFINGNLSGGYTTRFKMDDTCLIIGHNSSSKSFSLTTNDTKRLTVLGNGNVGIGTTDPTTKLDVNGGFRVVGNYNYGIIARFDYPGNGFGGIAFSGYANGSKGSELYNTGDFSLEIRKTDGSNTGKIVLLSNGNVGIGTTAPTYPLTVNGTIRSKKVIVDTGWSDFVFEDDYRLMPLHQLDKFIEENKHLPEIPSAKEVEANGISLGDMDAKLLQKIEELTLYTIEQQKMIDKLVKDNEELAKKVSKIQKRK
jgi:hypothetical protein